MNILVTVPELSSSGRGNRVTAVRWGRILADLGHDVFYDSEYRGQPCQLLIALHAIRSADAVASFREHRPDSPIVVALTGTDIYGPDEGFDEAAAEALQGSMKAATRLVVLQPLAGNEVPRKLRKKVVVIYQSAERSTGPTTPVANSFEVCVVGELREPKDPFRAALAARRLPTSSRIRVLHLGDAADEQLAARAAKEEQANPRYSWLGELPHAEALSIIGRCRLLVNSSKREGGSTAISEALARGLPVLATRIPGNVGLLGKKYAGLFDFGDTEALCELLNRAETDEVFYGALQSHCEELAALADPQRECQAWADLLEDLS